MEYKNKQASFNYFIDDVITAGIMLKGSEVKSIKSGAINFLQSYCAISEGELWLNGLHISDYAWASSAKHENLRQRKLLVKKRELKKIQKKVKEKGMTIVPLRLFKNEKGLIKIEIGLATGKKLHDKRNAIKERDLKKLPSF